MVSKAKKLSKNRLTNKNKSAIICKLTTSGHKNGGELKAKKYRKNF